MTSTRKHSKIGYKIRTLFTISTRLHKESSDSPAPVRVAQSIIRSGSSSHAATIASAKTRRPSASVFPISVVNPFLACGKGKDIIRCLSFGHASQIIFKTMTPCVVCVFFYHIFYLQWTTYLDTDSKTDKEGNHCLADSFAGMAKWEASLIFSPSSSWFLTCIFSQLVDCKKQTRTRIVLLRFKMQQPSHQPKNTHASLMRRVRVRLCKRVRMLIRVCMENSRHRAPVVCHQAWKNFLKSRSPLLGWVLADPRRACSPWSYVPDQAPAESMSFSALSDTSGKAGTLLVSCIWPSHTKIGFQTVHSQLERSTFDSTLADLKTYLKFWFHTDNSCAQRLRANLIEAPLIRYWHQQGIVTLLLAIHTISQDSGHPSSCNSYHIWNERYPPSCNSHVFQWLLSFYLQFISYLKMIITLLLAIHTISLNHPYPTTCNSDRIVSHCIQIHFCSFEWQLWTKLSGQRVKTVWRGHVAKILKDGGTIFQ